MDTSTLAADVPDEFGKQMCACIVCKLVKTFNQFVANGCENCQFLNMAGDRDRVSDCVTGNFSGLMSVMDPGTSWVAKWSHVNKRAVGCYALEVQDELPPEIQDELDSRRNR